MASLSDMTRLGRSIAVQIRSPERIRQFAALGIRILSAAIGYAILAAAARVTSLADFSDLALVLAATGMFGAIATLGQETILLRRLPLACADGHRGYRALVTRGARIVAGGLAACALAAMAYAGHSFVASGPLPIALTGLLVIASGTAELLFAIQRGGGSVLGAVFRRELVWKIVLFGAIVALWLAGRHVGVATLAAWYLAGTLIAVGLSLLPVVAQWHSAPADRESPRDDGPKDSALSFFLLNFINQAGTQLDILVLGALSTIPPAQLGACYAAQRLIQILFLLPYGAAITSAPRIPLAFAEGNMREITRLSRQISREVAAVVLLLTILAFVFRAPLMGSFRPEFIPYAIVLPVLALIPLASAIGGLHTVVAPMCGMERPYARWRLGIIAAFLAIKLAIAALFAGSPHLLLLFVCTVVVEALVVVVTGVLMARRRLGIWIV